MQNNLGNVLATLGKRERGTESLEQAVTAYTEALKEITRERVPTATKMRSSPAVTPKASAICTRAKGVSAVPRNNAPTFARQEQPLPDVPTVCECADQRRESYEGSVDHSKHRHRSSEDGHEPIVRDRELKSPAATTGRPSSPPSPPMKLRDDQSLIAPARGVALGTPYLASAVCSLCSRAT